MAEKKDFKVTPWEVRGRVDYDKLVEEFGIEKIDKKLLARIKKHTGELHPFLRRGLFFAHRDLRWLLDEYEKGNKFYLYTGRGPSGQTHLGHMTPWIFTKWLQDKFKAKLVFQLTDDEKFVFKPDLTIENVKKFDYENILDIIATGFDPKKTEIFSDLDYSKTLYNQAVRVAKNVTFSQARSVFGFTNDSNIGQIFFTSMQSVPAFLESIRKGKNIPCLIPHAVDQDPHFRITRDVTPKLGYYKPASIQGRFLSGLGKGGKMSSSRPETAINTIDSPLDVNKKIINSYTGGKESVKEQREKGGEPDICPIFDHYKFLFEEDDKKLEGRRQSCKAGELLCGECKKDLIERVNKFLKKHQERRENAKNKIDDFVVRD